LTKQQLDFLAKVTQPALDTQRVFGIPAAVTIAQAIIESATPAGGWGSSRLFCLANNPFGIKYAHSQGAEDYGHFDCQTCEVIAGRPVEVPAEFQAFHNLKDAFVRHGLLLMRPRYQPAFAERGNWQLFAERLGPKTSPTDTEHCGYSTNPSYSARLVKLVTLYGLDIPSRLALFAQGIDPGPLMAQSTPI
jgi:flagellum-specific peptidoglycan hydrolase FlgJ